MAVVNIFACIETLAIPGFVRRSLFIWHGVVGHAAEAPNRWADQALSAATKWYRLSTMADFDQVPELVRHGAWISHYAITPSNAQAKVDSAQRLLSIYEEDHAALLADGVDELEASHMLDANQSDLEDAVVSALVYSAFAIEGATNHYGTLAVGETFFRAHLERASIESKLALVVAIRGRGLLRQDSEVLVALRRLFQTRNRMAHRKTRELDFSTPAQASPVELQPNRVLEVAAVALSAFSRFLAQCEPNAPMLEFPL